MDQFAHIQDVVGQLPQLKTYSHLLLAFPLEDSAAARQSAVQSLRSAALKVTESFPWLAAKVVNRGSGPDSSGLFQLEPCSSWSAPQGSIVRVRDAANVCPSYSQIVEARGPASMLSGDILAPRKAFPESYQETDEDPAPVIVFQATVIQGGLLLDCAAQHNIIDMSGIEQCFNLLAAALRRETFSSDAIQQGNLDRRNLVPLLPSNEPTHDHSHLRRPSPSDPIVAPLEPESSFSWCYFRFSASKLAQLKALATPDIQSNCETSAHSFVSTNDALIAFCWQRVITMRLKRRQTPHETAKLLRAVDARKVMGVPPGYMGDLVTIATATMTFDELASASLSTVALMLRQVVAAVNTREYVRSYATLIANTPDKASIVYGGKWNPDTCIGSSSWAHVQLAHVPFGSLGKPSLVRRPNFPPLKSNIYFMPQTAKGDVDALVCFNDHDMSSLKDDKQWNEYADMIG